MDEQYNDLAPAKRAIAKTKALNKLRLEMGRMSRLELQCRLAFLMGHIDALTGQLPPEYPAELRIWERGQ